MRIVSLLPSATEIVCALGLREALVGITHECDFPEGIGRDKPVLIEAVIGPEWKEMHPAAIDRKIRETVARGEGVYRFRPGALEAARPDLVVTQGICDVCAVPKKAAVEAIRSLRPEPALVSLDPTSLGSILEDILRVGEAAGRVAEAGRLVASLRARIEAVRARTAPIPPGMRPRVAVIEWLDPIFAAGHWVPEMVEIAGGIDVLASADEPSKRIEWDAVVASRPDVVIVAPCGYPEPLAAEGIRHLAGRPGWADLPAVRAGRVHAIDANAYVSRPGPRIVDGLERIAEMLHPPRR